MKVEQRSTRCPKQGGLPDRGEETAFIQGWTAGAGECGDGARIRSVGWPAEGLLETSTFQPAEPVNRSPHVTKGALQV